MMILSTSISVRARRSTADRSSQAGDGERDQGQPVPTRLWLVVKLDNILVARFPLHNGIEPLMFSYWTTCVHSLYRRFKSCYPDHRSPCQMPIRIRSRIGQRLDLAGLSGVVLAAA